MHLHQGRVIRPEGGAAERDLFNTHSEEESEWVGGGG